MFLSDEGATLETLDFAFHIIIAPTFYVAICIKFGGDDVKSIDSTPNLNLEPNPAWEVTKCTCVKIANEELNTGELVLMHEQWGQFQTSNFTCTKLNAYVWTRDELKALFFLATCNTTASPIV